MDPMNQLVWALICIFLIVSRPLTEHSGKVREIARRQYRRSFYPYPFRVTPAIGPLTGLGGLVVLASIYAPHGVGAVVGTLGMALAGASGAVAYRRPLPFAPRWMREDLASGRLPEARFDATDRLLRWMFVFAAVVLALSGIFLTLAGWDH
jgi:hypothetical protein